MTNPADAETGAIGQPPRVLVIDDDEPLLRMLWLSLSSYGLRVVTAADGIAGLERLADNEFDVIVLDLQMPKMDGRAFYREMAARGHDTPVIILSAYGAEEAKRELNAAAAIPKPFDPDFLADTVQRLASRP
jgi:DNA-binding response OmpR family regulator